MPTVMPANKLGITRCYIPPILLRSVMESLNLTQNNRQQGHYALNISRRDSTRSIRGRMPSSVEIIRDSSNKRTALA